MKVALFIVLGTVGMILPRVIGSSNRAPEQATSINVSDLNRLQVIGQLGQPLGKIVVVEGVVADDSYRHIKADLGETLLRITTLNGKQLAEERVFPYRGLTTEVEKPKVGSKFKFSGYETGGFTGVPAGTFEYTPAFATTGYYFTTNFVVIRDEMRPAK
jgi:hypothetical protein